MRRLMMWSFGFLIAGSTLMSSVAQADTHSFRSRREIRKDRKAVQDDHLDLARLRALRDRFDRAQSSKASDVELTLIDVELRNLLRKELRESKKELRSDVKDASHNHEGTRREKVLGRAPMDRRDANDDYKDIKFEADALSRKQSLMVQLDAMAGRTDADAQAYRKNAIETLIRLAEVEYKNADKELKSDKERYERENPNGKAPY